MRLLVACALCAASAHLSAQPYDPPELQAHQYEMERVLRPTALDIENPMAVFSFVLGSLPERVRVFPTENYFYFSFTHNGVPYAGNIRLDASDRDQGKVHFAYFEQAAGWHEEPATTYRVLDLSNGVLLEKIDRFMYRLAYDGRGVLFELNDLSQVKPPPSMLAAGERFIGPVFDESGIRFFLVYNPAIRNFLYLLDETEKVPDGFSSREGSERTLVGKRTGFVLYRDWRLDRKILVGVYEDNAVVNNYFDGPFDQLPDNFIEGESLRSAILEVDPSLKGKIDRFGGSPDGAVRYMIAPYLLYREMKEFAPLHRCATRHRQDKKETAYYRCFILDNEPQDLTVGPPAR